MYGPTREESQAMLGCCVFIIVGIVVLAFLAGRYLPLPTIEIHW